MLISVCFCVILLTSVIVLSCFASPQIKRYSADGDFKADATGLGGTGEKPVSDILTHYRTYDVAAQDNFVKKRRKRGFPIAIFTLGIAAAKGAFAIKAVLPGAMPVTATSRWYREYLKRGGYKQAQRDFDLAKPTDVRAFSYPDGVYGKAGEVGDRTIRIQNGEATGSDTTLEIIKKFKVDDMTMDRYRPGKELVDKITYLN